MSFATPLRDIEKLKQQAKQAKSTHPHLTHAQRLNMVAQAEHGARSFHEVRSRAKSILAEYQEKKGGLAQCRLCGLLFVPFLSEDVKQHNKQHLLYEEVLVAQGRVPEGYHQREESKRRGRELARAAAAPEDELAAVEIIVGAWYDRSLESAITGGYWKKHPDFDKFAAMIFPLANRFMTQASELYLQKYGPNPGGIPEGKSYWLLSQQ